MPHEEPTEDLLEYLEALQDQIDHLVDRDERRLQRIARLERDRTVLRERLDKTAAVSSSRWRRSRSTDTDDLGESTSSDIATPPVLEVPGVGSIGAVTPGPSDPRSLTVATIVDGFTESALGPEWNGVPLPADGWRPLVAATRPDLLFVESAYAGVDGSWATRVARFGSPSPRLTELVEWFRERSIPTVFWNKEDPINFEWFRASSSLFDVVLTVDENVVGRYRSDLGHDRVALLPFFAQPSIHRRHDGARPGGVAFAGTYFSKKHSERQRQIEMILEPARRHGLQIFDRHGQTNDARFAWPERFRSHIVGTLTYLQTVRAYQLYRIFLNVNTVTESPTMCARRIFELAACGTPIVTGPSAAIGPTVPTAAVAEVSTAEEAGRTIGALLDEPESATSMTDLAYQWVMDGHTAARRVDRIVDLANL